MRQSVLFRSSRALAVTRPDKLMFPRSATTKADVVAYYSAVAPFILPHLKSRPLTLKLYPDGIQRKHLYIKDAPPYTPAWVPTFAVERKDKSHGRPEIRFILVNNRRTLLWVANLASLEMHIFLAKVPAIDRPSFVAFDLDPGPPADLLSCIEALAMRELLDALKLSSFVKVSGSKGLQIYVPLNGRDSYEQTGTFARKVAERMEHEHPSLVVATMAKSLRSGKVFIDWSQNVYYKTTVCVYSLRAKHDEPFISFLFEWADLRRAWKAGNAESLFVTPDEVIRKLKRSGDRFAPVLKVKQKLPSALAGIADSRGTAVGGRKQSAPVRRAGRRAHRSGQKPAFVEPMQPELVSTLPEGSRWRYEAKWDGYRVIAVKDGRQVTLFSRNKNDLTPRYPAVARALAELPCKDAVMDGEVIAVDHDGRPSFALLQNAGHEAGARVLLVVFDLLWLDGQDLTREPLDDRQRLLRQLTAGSRIQSSDPLPASAREVVTAVRRLGLEGVVAKDGSSIYEPGMRGNSWFKCRLTSGQEFVVGGYTEGTPIHSLLVGYYDSGRLLYAGKVKAGLVTHQRQSLFRQLKPLETVDCPFANLRDTRSSRRFGFSRDDLQECRWVRPQLIVQVSFVEWTKNNQLRHPRFLGVRDDKAPQQVIRER